MSSKDRREVPGGQRLTSSLACVCCVNVIKRIKVK